MGDGDAVTVVVQAAMDEEAGAIVAIADRIDREEDHAGAHRWYGSLAGREFIVVRGGIGLVNAAASATAILDEVADRDGVLLISAGTAGGLGADVRVGDVIVAETSVHGDVDVRAFDYALGQVPGMPERYASSADVLESAPRTLEGAGLPGRTGAIVSTDAFVTPEKARRILADFPATLSVDMESSAIAQVAFRYGVPFVSVRAVSDLADNETGEVFDSNLGSAAERAAAAVAAIVRS